MGNNFFRCRTTERIKKAEDEVLFSEFGYLTGSIAHVKVLREKSRIAREAGLLEVNPDAIDSEANRMEEAFYARERADQARHGLPCH